MPNNATDTVRVTAAYNKWLRLKLEFEEKSPGVTKADVVNAYKKMQDAIREWEAPGPEETKEHAKADRKRAKKIWWPKFK